MLLGRRVVGVAAIAEDSTLEIVKPSLPACAAGFGALLAMAECIRKRAYFTNIGQSIYRKGILLSRHIIDVDASSDRPSINQLAYLPGSAHCTGPRLTATWPVWVDTSRSQPVYGRRDG